MLGYGKYKLVSSIGAAAILAIAAPASAVVYNSTVPIPITEVITNFNNTGLDWVYAGPIAPNEFGAGNTQPATYRSGEGWRVATVSEWSLHPIWSDFTRPGFSTPAANGGFGDHTSYRFTSEYWSDYHHVDLNDFANGNVTDGVNGQVSGVPETIYVRNSLIAPVAGVPEPATWAMMLIGFGAVGAGMRRRKQEVRVRFANA